MRIKAKIETPFGSKVNVNAKKIAKLGKYTYLETLYRSAGLVKIFLPALKKQRKSSIKECLLLIPQTIKQIIGISTYRFPLHK